MVTTAILGRPFAGLVLVLGQELAVVVDDGTTVGLVTATDAFEAIAGELEDPLDDADTDGSTASVGG